MPGVLIASDRQHHEALRCVFAANGQPVRCCTSAGEARRALCDGDFSLLIVNAPLPDEFGRDLAAQAVHDGLDSILLCAAPQADKVAAGLEKYGVYVLPNPLSRQQAMFALRVIRTGRQRMRRILEQNVRLTKRLDEARVVSQAKCVLARCCGMTEEQAHHAIEKRAMDARVSSREAALEILKNYE
ncbi:ANTAR domain-containing response regulator [uncultured Ruthenibacterium sp.]|uniref:ANTAR domain-containing response regulator n=1 Tax=uncultured Ruthenibacterium sp. TaxID=1905347 RepID=UPI00349E6195